MSFEKYIKPSNIRNYFDGLKLYKNKTGRNLISITSSICNKYDLLDKWIILYFDFENKQIKFEISDEDNKNTFKIKKYKTISFLSNNLSLPIGRYYLTDTDLVFKYKEKQK